MTAGSRDHPQAWRGHGRELSPGSQELWLEVEEHNYHLQNPGQQGGRGEIKYTQPWSPTRVSCSQEDSKWAQVGSPCVSLPDTEIEEESKEWIWRKTQKTSRTILKGKERCFPFLSKLSPYGKARHLVSDPSWVWILTKEQLFIFLLTWKRREWLHCTIKWDIYLILRENWSIAPSK